MPRGRGRWLAPALVLAALLATLFPTAPAQATTRSHLEPVEITFPVHGPHTFTRDYEACRDGCSRRHLATDIMAAVGTPVHAAMGGTVRWITGLDGIVPSYGYMITIAGDDGRTYSYIHLGRQDKGWRKAYVPGLDRGVRVERGQHIGWAGCSGNAVCSAPHLHFEIEDPAVEDPYGGNRVDPYESLVAALEREGLPGFHDVSGRTKHYANIELATDAGLIRNCKKGPDRYCPKRTVKHKQAALALARGTSLRWSEVPVLGSGDHTRQLTRGRLARAIARTLGLEQVAADGFTDLSTSKKGHRLMAAVVEAGIMDPCKGGDSFCPKASVNRKQLATYVSRALLGSSR